MPRPAPRRCDRRRGERVPRRYRLALALASVGLETLALHRRSGRLAGDVVVRCRDGHLFTTIWIPGASLKSLRLLWWRIQRCPVGGHWSIVTPMRESELSAEERLAAGAEHDIRIP